MVLSPRSAPLFGRAEKTEKSTGVESEETNMAIFVMFSLAISCGDSHLITGRFYLDRRSDK